jgi:hypothetical protein
MYLILGSSETGTASVGTRVLVHICYCISRRHCHPPIHSKVVSEPLPLAMMFNRLVAVMASA